MTERRRAFPRRKAARSCRVLLIPALFLLFSCRHETAAQFLVPPGTVLYGPDGAAARGLLAFPEKGKTFTWRFDPPLLTGEGESLRVDFAGVPGGALVFSFGFPGGAESAWDFQAEKEGGKTSFSWAVPVEAGKTGFFSVSGSGGTEIELLGIHRERRAFGFRELPQGTAWRSPFVRREPGRNTWIIGVPGEWFPAFPALTLESPQGSAVITTGMRRIEWSAFSGYAEGLRQEIPPGFFRNGDFSSPLRAEFFAERQSGSALPLALFLYGGSSPGSGGTEAISLDPGLILEYPAENWQDRRRGIFRWDGFPQVIIFDTADYAIQEQYFKRLAFFVEKAGYRGRPLPFEALLDLHGWNAHDYRAESLAAFFNALLRRGLPLLPEERELRGILIESGVLHGRAGTDEVDAGEGAVLSISRESPEHLRRRFMAHEGFHGLFFIDPEFRDFAARRWSAFNSPAKNFFLSWLSFQGYDTADSFLVLNEFMAYCLQQDTENTARYFGETLARQMDAHPWRGAVLPPPVYGPEGEKKWPETGAAFSRETAAFSRFVEERYGFRAGSVSRFRVRPLD